MEKTSYFDPLGRFAGETVPCGDFIANPGRILNRAEGHNVPLRVQGADADAIVMDFDAFARLCEQKDLFEDLLVGMSEIDRGEGIPHEEFVKQLKEDERLWTQPATEAAAPSASRIAVAV